MAENHMNEVAKMLGVELGEEFEVEGMTGVKYRLSEEGLTIIARGTEHTPKSIVFIDLLCGRKQIVRRPWRPKVEQEYWSVFLHQDGSWYADNYCYNGDVTDLSFILADNCFPTREAAEEAAPDVVKFYEDVRKMVVEA